MNATALVILAVASGKESSPPPPGLLESLKLGNFPDRLQYVQELARMHEFWAILLVLAGLIYLLSGLKIFKFLVTINAAAIGVLAGAGLGGMASGQNVQIIAAVAGALVLGVLAWQLLKAAVSLMAGLAGAMAGYGLWSYIAVIAGRPNVAEHAWAGGLLGFVTFSLLTLVLFKWIIMLFTAYQGAVMAVSGVLALLLKPYFLYDRLHVPLVENVHLIPILLGVPTVLGFFFQYTAGKGGKKKPPGG